MNQDISYMHSKGSSMINRETHEGMITHCGKVTAHNIKLYIDIYELLIFHLDWPAKNDPHKSGFRLQNLHFRQVEPDLWGSFFARKIANMNMISRNLINTHENMKHMKTT